MSNAIIYPAICLALLTIGVCFWMGKSRLNAVKAGQADRAYFKLYQGEPPSGRVTQISQHYDNLLALPILFYVVVIIIYITHTVGELQLLLAWGFVASRIVHTVVHTTSNRLKYRFYSFAAGLLILLVMWLVLLLNLASS